MDSRAAIAAVRAARSMAFAECNLPIWVLLGPPGSGKGTYASLIAPRFGLDHVSPGELVREALSRPELASQRRAVEAGQLLPDAMVIALLRERLCKTPACARGVLLDGFPRTAEQAKLLDATANVVVALRIHLEDKHILAKIAGRRVCNVCSRSYNLANVCDKEGGVIMPPILPSGGDPSRCDCGALLQARSDDAPAVAAQRLRRDHDASKPVLEFYRQRGVLMDHRVQRGVADMDDLAARLVAKVRVEDQTRRSNL